MTDKELYYVHSFVDANFRLKKKFGIDVSIVDFFGPDDRLIAKCFKAGSAPKVDLTMDGAYTLCKHVVVTCFSDEEPFRVVGYEGSTGSKVGYKRFKDGKVIGDYIERSRHRGANIHSFNASISATLKNSSTVKITSEEKLSKDGFSKQYQPLSKTNHFINQDGADITVEVHNGPSSVLGPYGSLSAKGNSEEAVYTNGAQDGVANIDYIAADSSVCSGFTHNIYVAGVRVKDHFAILSVRMLEFLMFLANISFKIGAELHERVLRILYIYLRYNCVDGFSVDDFTKHIKNSGGVLHIYDIRLKSDMPLDMAPYKSLVNTNISVWLDYFINKKDPTDVNFSERIAMYRLADEQSSWISRISDFFATDIGSELQIKYNSRGSHSVGRSFFPLCVLAGRFIHNDEYFNMFRFAIRGDNPFNLWAILGINAQMVSPYSVPTFIRTVTDRILINSLGTNALFLPVKTLKGVAVLPFVLGQEGLSINKTDNIGFIDKEVALIDDGTTFYLAQDFAKPAYITVCDGQVMKLTYGRSLGDFLGLNSVFLSLNNVYYGEVNKEVGVPISALPMGIANIGQPFVLDLKIDVSTESAPIQEGQPIATGEQVREYFTHGNESDGNINQYTSRGMVIRSSGKVVGVDGKDKGLGGGFIHIPEDDIDYGPHLTVRP